MPDTDYACPICRRALRHVGQLCSPECTDRIFEAISKTPSGKQLVDMVEMVLTPSPTLLASCRVEYERQHGPDAKLTEAERTEKRLRDRLAQYSEALTYIERHVPGGIQIVAASMGGCPPEECPALQALLDDRDTAWGVAGRYVQFSGTDGTGPVFPLRLHWEMLRKHLGDAGYRQMLATGNGSFSTPSGPISVACINESDLSDADLIRLKELEAARG